MSRWKNWEPRAAAEFLPGRMFGSVDRTSLSLFPSLLASRRNGNFIVTLRDSDNCGAGYFALTFRQLIYEHVKYLRAVAGVSECSVSSRLKTQGQRRISELGRRGSATLLMRPFTFPNFPSSPCPPFYRASVVLIKRVARTWTPI